MDGKDEFRNPNDWASGPPESKTESWNFERRGEIAGWSESFIGVQIARMFESPEAWKGQGGIEAIDTDVVVDLAVRLQKSIDSRCPKR